MKNYFATLLFASLVLTIFVQTQAITETCPWSTNFMNVSRCRITHNVLKRALTDNEDNMYLLDVTFHAKTGAPLSAVVDVAYHLNFDDIDTITINDFKWTTHAVFTIIHPAHLLCLPPLPMIFVSDTTASELLKNTKVEFNLLIDYRQLPSNFTAYELLDVLGSITTKLAYLHKNHSNQADYVLQSDFADFGFFYLFMCCMAFLTLGIPVIIIYKTRGNLWMPGPKYKEFYKGSLLFLFLLYMADFITFLSTYTRALYSKEIKIAILCTVPISGLFFSLVQYCVKSWQDKKCIIDRQCCLQSILSLGFFMIVTYTILSVLPILLLFFIHPVNTAIITIYPVAATMVLCRWVFSNRDSSFFIMFAKIYCPCCIIMSLSMLLGIFLAKMIQDSDTQKIQVILTFIPPIIGILAVYLKGWIKKAGEQTGGTTSSTNGNEEEESSRPSGTPNANYGSTEHTTLVVNDTEATK